MKILCTGASGFIGKRLCAVLETAGHHVIKISTASYRIAPNNPFWEASGTIDQIWHLAAWTQAGRFCLDHSGEQWLINQRINTEIIEYWRERQPQATFVSFGTSCAYDPALPMTEDNYLRGSPHADLVTYAMTKRMLQAGVEAMGKQYGMKWLTVVPGTVYGPGYHRDGRQLHFIYDLARKIIEAEKTGVPPVLWGDGHQSREIIHLDEIVPVVCDLAFKDHTGLFNIPGHQGTIGWFAHVLCEIVGYDPRSVVYDKKGYVGVRSKVLDGRKIDGIMTDRPMVHLISGLNEIVKEMT